MSQERFLEGSHLERDVYVEWHLTALDYTHVLIGASAGSCSQWDVGRLKDSGGIQSLQITRPARAKSTSIIHFGGQRADCPWSTQRSKRWIYNIQRPVFLFTVISATSCLIKLWLSGKLSSSWHQTGNICLLHSAEICRKGEFREIFHWKWGKQSACNQVWGITTTACRILWLSKWNMGNTVVEFDWRLLKEIPGTFTIEVKYLITTDHFLNALSEVWIYFELTAL